MNELNNVEPKIKKGFIKNNSSKFLQVFAIIIAIVLVLVVFVSDFDFLSNNKNSIKQSATFEEYVLNLESKISQTISNIEGVGKATVTITFESNIEKTFAYESVTQTSTGVITEELILYKGEPIVLKEITPKVKGVVVVAKGATNAMVRLNIIRTIQILLDVTYDKIEVFTYKV